MPLRVWLLGAFLALPVGAATPLPVVGEIACPAELAASAPLFDGSAFDPTNAHHRLARPLLALRLLWLQKSLPLNEPRPFAWRGRTYTVHASENSVTGDFSTVGEHCPDVEIHVTRVGAPGHLTFHVSQPMVLALRGERDVWVDLYHYELTDEALESLFGPPF